MKIINEEVEVTTKKSVKRFVLTEKEMYALRLLVGPMSQIDIVNIMKGAREAKYNDNLLDLADTLQNAYLGAGGNLNANE